MGEYERLIQGLRGRLSRRIASADELPKLSGTPEQISEAEDVRTRVLAYMATHRMRSSREETVLRTLRGWIEAEAWLQADKLSKSTGELHRYLLLLSEGVNAKEKQAMPKAQTDQKAPQTKKVSETGRTVYLIDCENVCYKHPYIRQILEDKTAIVKFFVSEHSQGLAGNEPKILSVARASVEFVPCVSGGKNSMDFQIVAHVGLLMATEPRSSIRIVSQDKGYESALPAFRKRGCDICCVNPFTETQKC